MKRLVIGLLCLASLSAKANEIEMNKTLVQIINQINAIMPLIDEAKSVQPKGTRVKFNLEKYKNSKGVYVNGIREDLLAIKQGVIEYINKPDITPKTIDSLEFDFVEDRG